MFCTFIFAVLVLKYCFPTGDQLQRYCASDISYTNQATYKGYLLPNSMTTRVEQEEETSCWSQGGSTKSAIIAAYSSIEVTVRHTITT